MGQISRIFFVLSLMTVSTLSRMLYSSEVLVGEWKLDVRCYPKWLQSHLYPSHLLPRISLSPGWITRKHRCSLQMYENNTFVLKPDNETLSSRSLPMRGSWKLRENPYCVTDRFHSDLELTSLRRVKYVDVTANVGNRHKCYSHRRLKFIRR